MSTEALEVTDRYSAERSVAPRVSVASMEDRMADVAYVNLGDALERTGQDATAPAHLMTLCVITMTNGFVVLGKSAPASPANFDVEKGRTFAYEDAVRQLWPLEAYLLREQLTQIEDRAKA